MNKERRARLKSLRQRLEDITDGINEIADEEQEAFDNLPESLQNGGLGQAMQEAIDQLNAAFEAAEEAANCLDNAGA